MRYDEFGLPAGHVAGADRQRQMLNQAALACGASACTPSGQMVQPWADKRRPLSARAVSA
jgi:hypothetical protein